MTIIEGLLRGMFHHLLEETYEVSISVNIANSYLSKRLAEGTVCYSFEVLLDNACPGAYKKDRLARSGLP